MPPPQGEHWAAAGWLFSGKLLVLPFASRLTQTLTNFTLNTA